MKKTECHSFFATNRANSALIYFAPTALRLDSKKRRLLQVEKRAFRNLLIEICSLDTDKPPSNSDILHLIKSVFLLLNFYFLSILKVLFSTFFLILARLPPPPRRTGMLSCLSRYLSVSINTKLYLRAIKFLIFWVSFLFV